MGCLRESFTAILIGDTDDTAVMWARPCATAMAEAAAASPVV
jgi:hypothetical protein